jgi:hypothetical protein
MFFSQMSVGRMFFLPKCVEPNKMKTRLKQTKNFDRLDDIFDLETSPDFSQIECCSIGDD